MDPWSVEGENGKMSPIQIPILYANRTQLFEVESGAFIMSPNNMILKKHGYGK